MVRTIFWRAISANAVCAVLFAIGVFAAPLANAVAIYEFTGRVTSTAITVGMPPLDVVSLGDALTGRIVYNPDEIQPRYTNANRSYTDPIFSIQMSNGFASWGSTFGLGDLATGTGLHIENGRSGRLVAPGIDCNCFDDGAADVSLPNVLSWLVPESFPGTITIPYELDETAFSGGVFDWEFTFPTFVAPPAPAPGVGRLRIGGTIDTLVRVPEPSTLPLFALALTMLGIGAARRRRMSDCGALDIER